MLLVAVLLFALAALGGLVMVYVRTSSGSNPPLALAAVHGLAAASGLALLLAAIGTGRATGAVPDVSAGLFGVAALGGAALILTHLRGSPISIPLTLIHAGVAVVGFLALLAAALG